MFNITLIQSTFGDGTSCPVTLQIDDELYNYGECELFEKLTKYKGNEILVKYTGYKNNNRKYIIEDVIMNGIPKLKLKEINEII